MGKRQISQFRDLLLSNRDHFEKNSERVSKDFFLSHEALSETTEILLEMSKTHEIRSVFSMVSSIMS